MLGGIVPVPVAVGISDEHRRKLLRIAHKLGQPFILFDRKTLERIGQFVQQSGDAELAASSPRLGRAAFVVEDLNDISRAGRVARSSATGRHGFIQFSSGSTSDPKGVVLTHAQPDAHSAGADAGAGFNERDTSLSWMPLTHDMGLIGFPSGDVCGTRAHAPDAHRTVRAPAAAVAVHRERDRRHHLCSPNFGYRHYLKVLAERSPGDLDLSGVRLIFNGAEPISVELCEEFLARMHRRSLARPCTRCTDWRRLHWRPLFRPWAMYRPPPLLATRSSGEGAGAAARGHAVALRSWPSAADPRLRTAHCGDDDQRSPEGHIGHILIRGDNVTGGYFREPEVNAQRCSPTAGCAPAISAC